MIYKEWKNDILIKKNNQQPLEFILNIAQQQSIGSRMQSLSTYKFTIL